MRTHLHTNDAKTAIGYVRVSTQEQATEGVSLDAQRDRLRTYCKLHSIKLIDIKADEGISGSTLDRPGLQAALQMIRRDRANTLLVAKLDRPSRSLRDVCTLVEELFSDERYHLLSLWSSSQGGLRPQGPRRSRTRRFPPYGSSVDASRG